MALKVMVKSVSPGGHEGIWGCGAAADCEIGERAVGGGEMLIHTWRNLIFTSHVGTAYKWGAHCIPRYNSSLNYRERQSSHHASHSVQVRTMSFKITHWYLSHLRLWLWGGMQSTAHWLWPSQAQVSSGLGVNHSTCWLATDPELSRPGWNCIPTCQGELSSRRRLCCCCENAILARGAQLNAAPFKFGQSVFSISLIHAVYILLLPVPEITALGTAPCRYC